jgi:two-component system sensor histidine kinase MprB
MSLRTRVAIAVGAVVFCALAIVAAVVYPVVGVNLRGQNDASLVQVAKNAPSVTAKLKQSGSLGQLVPFGSTQLQILPAAAAGPTKGFVAVSNQDVQVAYGKEQPYFHNELYGNVDYRIYTAPFAGASGVLVRVAQPVSAATSTQTALGWLLIALVPAGAIAAAAVARLAAGRVLRPVGRLTETVERIRATGDLSAPIETPGHDEISRLGQAFAAMTAALDESAGAQRRLVADASHELRTPLTSLITNLELLAEQPDDPSVPALAAAALAEAGELRVLVNDLVELARDGEASLHIEDVRLDLVAERVAARAGHGRGQRQRSRDSRGGSAVHLRSLLPVGKGPGAARLGPWSRDRPQDHRHARRNRRGASAAARGNVPHQPAGARRRSARLRRYLAQQQHSVASTVTARPLPGLRRYAGPAGGAPLLSA